MNSAKVVPDIPPEKSPPICYNYPDPEQDDAGQEAIPNMAKQPDPDPAGKPTRQFPGAFCVRCVQGDEKTFVRLQFPTHRALLFYSERA